MAFSSAYLPSLVTAMVPCRLPNQQAAAAQPGKLSRIPELPGDYAGHRRHLPFPQSLITNIITPRSHVKCVAPCPSSVCCCHPLPNSSKQSNYPGLCSSQAWQVENPGHKAPEPTAGITIEQLYKLGEAEVRLGCRVQGFSSNGAGGG